MGFPEGSNMKPPRGFVSFGGLLDLVFIRYEKYDFT
jgi:hypothetical protein